MVPVAGGDQEAWEGHTICNGVLHVRVYAFAVPGAYFSDGRNLNVA